MISTLTFSARLLAATLILVAAASCATNDDAVSPEFGYRVIPIARLVSSASHPVTEEFLLAYEGRSEFRASEYNERFRRPGVHGDITIVDCQSVDSIGIYFWVDTSEEHFNSRTRTSHRPRFSWTHSKHELTGQKYNHHHYGKSFRLKGAQGRLTKYRDYLRLMHDHERVDGRYTVTVYYLGSPIYEDSFDLVGC